jgi:hypothetical protein
MKASAKRAGSRRVPPEEPGVPVPKSRNPRLNAQTRKVLRAHYAAKYRQR